MARSIFPDEGSRLAYRLSGAGRPILSAAGGTAVVYTTEAATTLADIQTLEGVPIAGSTMAVTAYSQLPLFLGPDGVDTVWTKIDGGPAAPVYARTDDRLDSLLADVSAALSGIAAAQASAAAAQASAATAATSASTALAQARPLEVFLWNGTQYVPAGVGSAAPQFHMGGPAGAAATSPTFDAERAGNVEIST